VAEKLLHVFVPQLSCIKLVGARFVPAIARYLKKGKQMIGQVDTMSRYAVDYFRFL